MNNTWLLSAIAAAADAAMADRFRLTIEKHKAQIRPPARTEGSLAWTRPIPSTFMNAADSQTRSGGFSNTQRPRNVGVIQPPLRAMLIASRV